SPARTDRFSYIFIQPAASRWPLCSSFPKSTAVPSIIAGTRCRAGPTPDFLFLTAFPNQDATAYGRKENALAGFSPRRGTLTSFLLDRDHPFLSGPLSTQRPQRTDQTQSLQRAQGTAQIFAVFAPSALKPPQRPQPSLRGKRSRHGGQELRLSSRSEEH